MALKFNSTIKDKSGNSYSAMHMKLRPSSISQGVDDDGNPTTTFHIYLDCFKNVTSIDKQPISADLDCGSIDFTLLDTEWYGTKTTPIYTPRKQEEEVRDKIIEINPTLAGKIDII